MATTDSRTLLIEAEGVAEGEGELPSVTPDRQGPGFGKPWWAWPLCLVLYLVMALMEFVPSTSLGSGRMVGPKSTLPDQIDQVWFLKWTEFAIAHGHNPFFTHWQNYPGGFNVVVNTSMISLGTLFSPVTAAFGPVVTWNVLARLALALSALSMCLVLRRWTRWWPAAFLGGLIYGYSAYATMNLGHLFLYFVPLPPLMLLVVYEIVFRQRWHSVKSGAVLGTLCGIQYLISSEILVSTMVIGVIAVVVYLVACRKDMEPRWHFIKTSTYTTVIVGGVLLAYPVGFTLFGPDAIQDSPQNPKALAVFHGDLLSAVIPGVKLYRSPLHPVYPYGASMYLGIPLVIAAIATVVWLRRRGIVVLAAAMTVIALALSSGATLFVDGTDTHVPLPFTVLAHLPLFDGLVPDRFAMFSAMFAAAILAVGIDELRPAAIRARWPVRMSSRLASAVAGSAVLLVVVAVLVPLIPRSPYPSIPSPTAPFFTSSAVDAIPPGSAVLAYPYPQAWKAGPASSQSVDDPLLDQAVSGMRFSMIGGYGWRPRWGYGTPEPAALAPRSVESLFNASFFGTATAPQLALVARSNLTADLRSFLRRHHVSTVIALPVGHDPGLVVHQITAAVGTPLRSGGVTVWSGVQRRLARIT